MLRSVIGCLPAASDSVNRIRCAIPGMVKSHVIYGGGAIKQPGMQGVLLLLLLLLLLPPMMMMDITAPMHLIR